MATDGPVSRWNGVEYAAADERALDAPLLLPDGTGGLAARAGKRPGGGLNVTATDLNVTVTPGAGVIYDPNLPSAGAWRFALPAQRTVSLVARPGSGTSRIDLIVARIYDADSASGPGKELKIERVEGAVHSNPVPPSLPPLSLELARVTVPATGSVTVIGSNQLTVAAGGVLPVASTAGRPTSPYVGQVITNLQTQAIEWWDGSTWRRYVEQKSGTITPSTGSASRTLEWVQTGSTVTLYGAISRSGSWTEGQTVTLGGIPAPSRSVATMGRISFRLVYLGLSASRVLTLGPNLSGSGSSSILDIDGLTYPTSAA